jgi:protein SCO1/2
MRDVMPAQFNPVWALAVIALAIAGGVGIGISMPPPADAPQLEWLDQPRPVANFTLSSNAQAFNTVSLLGHWQLLALGFTHCADVCPQTLTALSALHRVLTPDQVRLIFVSVDPQRDSPRLLAEYSAFFGGDIIAITGEDQQLHQLAASLGMDFRRTGPADNPIVSHSPTIALIGPEGFMRGRLRPGFEPRQVSRELAARIGMDL